jgi:TPP-dependent pyruvate/acetoin dehydrogenase alpha subunit
MAGIALSFRMRREPRVALLVDDFPGSASGDWHEGLNFAAVRGVPMVLVVETGPRRLVDARAATMADRAPAYGFTAHAVAGTDPREVEKVVWGAVEAARTGGGLQVVEVDPAESDPVEWLLDNRVAAEALTREAADALVMEARKEMERTLAEVEAEPDPDPDQALDPSAAGAPRGWAPWAAGS